MEGLSSRAVIIPGKKAIPAIKEDKKKGIAGTFNIPAEPDKTIYVISQGQAELGQISVELSPKDLEFFTNMLQKTVDQTVTQTRIQTLKIVSQTVTNLF